MLATDKARDILEEAANLIRETKPDTETLEAAMDDPFGTDGAKIVALLRELAEASARQDRVLDHICDHMIPGIDADMRLLREKVEAGSAKKTTRKE